jgi:hypothetical protein
MDHTDLAKILLQMDAHLAQMDHEFHTLLGILIGLIVVGFSGLAIGLGYMIRQAQHMVFESQQITKKVAGLIAKTKWADEA